MRNRVTVPGVSNLKIHQMIMGQFGTILEGRRTGEHVFMSDGGRLVFLNSGGSVCIDLNTSFGELKVMVQKSLLLETP